MQNTLWCIFCGHAVAQLNGSGEGRGNRSQPVWRFWIHIHYSVNIVLCRDFFKCIFLSLIPCLSHIDVFVSLSVSIPSLSHWSLRFTFCIHTVSLTFYLSILSIGHNSHFSHVSFRRSNKYSQKGFIYSLPIPFQSFFGFFLARNTLPLILNLNLHLWFEERVLSLEKRTRGEKIINRI